MTIPFIAVEISGLANPTYESGAANKKYVDAAVIGGTGDVVNWSTIAAGTGVIPFEGVIQASGATPVTVNVLGYTTISSQAKTPYDWYVESSQKISVLVASGTKYTDAYNWFTASSSGFDGLLDSGTKYSDVYSWYNATGNQFSNWLASGEKLSRWFSESSMKLGEIGASGEKWYKAYQSGQKAVPDASLSVGLVNRTAAFTYTAVTDNSVQWNAITASGTKYSDIYTWFNASSSGFDGILDSGAKYSDVYSWYNASGNLFDSLLDSGTKYTSAYQSSQALKEHSFQAKISSAYLALNAGWAVVADAGTIAHGLNSKPISHWVIPSGDVSFAISTKVDVTNITVRMSAPGDRDVQWWAQV